MIWLLRDFDLLSVLLRALTLAFEMLTVGGVAYLLLVAMPASSGQSDLTACRRGIRRTATALAIVEICYVAVDTSILMGSSALRLSELFLAPYFVAGVVAALAGLSIALCCGIASRRASYVLVPLSLLVLAAVVSTSHSASRLNFRFALAGLAAAHHLGAAIWIGAMPFLLISLRRAEDSGEANRLATRFSPMALAGAGILLAGGLGMAWFYLGISADHSLSGVYGTAYGVMLLSKIYLVVMITVMGAGNFFLVRGIKTAPTKLLTRLRRFGEAEIGLGFTAVLAAASMTSQPPAVDMPHDRLSVSEIVARFHPRPPRLTSPPLTDLSPTISLQESAKEAQFGGGSQENDDGNKAWSEYNHHWSGLIVLAAGAFALLSRLKSAQWARNWPIVFAGLAIFIVLRADPDSWPLGPRSFWGCFFIPDILQHRLYAALILAFAAFEWGVQTKRLQIRWAPMVFPLLCAAGGALLLTHNHSIGNIKEELLAEMSHTPIALLGATAGWSRWLELRLPDQKESKVASYVWPICLVLVGLVLLNYRES